MTSIIDATSDEGFEPSIATDEEGTGRAWRKLISTHATGTVHVMIWKADVGTYIARDPPYAETFVVLAGSARITVGNGAPTDIGPGAIVHMPVHAGMVLEVKSPYRMVATVVVERSR